MSSDSEKNINGQPSLPGQAPPPAQPAGNPETPRMILPEDDSEPDFIVDIPPAYTPAEPAAPPQTEQQPEDPAGPEETQAPETPAEEEPETREPGKKGFLARLLGYRLSFAGLFSRVKKDKAEKSPKPKKPQKEKKAKAPKSAPQPAASESSAQDGIVDPAQEGAGAAAGKKKAGKPPAIPRGKGKKTEEAADPEKSDKPEKPGKKKKPAKKPKAAKKAPKDSGEKKKISKKLIIIIIAGVIAIGAAVFAFLFLNREPPDPMAEAQALFVAGEYAAAREIYSGLLEDPDRAADAYLGVAESLIAEEDTEGAAERLRTGFEATGDPRLEARMLEIMPEEAEGLPPPPDPTPIVWQDAALERMVRLALEKPGGGITEADLEGVTALKILGSEHATTAADGLNSINTLEGYTLDATTYTEKGEITSLADIAHFKNLRRLTIGYNQINSLKGLEGLTSLELLALYVNGIEDLTPLSGLVNLRNLYLYGNAVTDLSPLRGLTGLRVLSAQHNAIADLSPLSGMTAMRELYLSGNSVSDISPLSAMAELIFLNAQNNDIADISALAGLSKLTDINFQGNPVTDFTPASHVQNIQSSFS